MPFGSIVYSPPYFKVHSLVFYIISSFIYNYKLKKSAFLSGIRVSKMLSGIRCFTLLYTFRLHFLILVFFCKQPNDDILQIIKEQKTHLNQSPFICCVGTLQNPASFSVVCEGEVIEAGHNSIDAFKTLYASFHMFRIQYPSLLSTFFYFFDSFIFHVHPGKIRPSVADLHVQLRAGLGSA